MAELSSEAVNELVEGLATTSDMPTSNVTASSIVRRSSRIHTGRDSLNVEDMVQTAGLTEPDVQTPKRASVSAKTPMKLRGILKKAQAFSKSSAVVEKNETEASQPGSGAKRKNGPVKTTTPRKRRKAFIFTKAPDSVPVYGYNSSKDFGS